MFFLVCSYFGKVLSKFKFGLSHDITIDETGVGAVRTGNTALAKEE